MKKLFVFLTLTILSTCLIPCQTVFAKTGYVSDNLILTFRQGPGRSFEVLKTLKSSTAVKVLEEQKGYLKVELDTKEIGWVDKKFIIYELPNAVIAQQLTREKEKLNNKITKLENKIKSLNKQLVSSSDENLRKINELDTSLSSALAEKQKLSKGLANCNKKYDTLIQQSKDIQRIVAENEKLKNQNKTLSTSVATLKEKNKNTLKSAYIKWFLAGVGTLSLGWFVGQMVAARKGRSHSSILD